MDLRDYDPAIARWVNIDPVTHHSQSPFVAFDCNPVSIADPSGSDGVIYGMAGQSASSNPYPRGRDSFLTGNPRSLDVGKQNGIYDGWGAGSSSSIFWGSERSLFEQSFEGHILSGIYSTDDPTTIFNILNQYSYESNGWIHYSWTEATGEGSSGLTATFMNVKSQNNLDLSSLFDRQVKYTREFFSTKSKELERLPVLPASKFLTRLIYFTKMVETNAKFDLKNGRYSEKLIGRYSEYYGMPMRFDDYGNYNYGVAAKAYGISLEVALLGAGLNQVGNGRGNISNLRGYFDESRDTRMIIMGYNAP